MARHNPGKDFNDHRFGTCLSRNHSDTFAIYRSQDYIYAFPPGPFVAASFLNTSSMLQ